MLGFGIFICGGDEWDDQILKGREQLKSLVRTVCFITQSFWVLESPCRTATHDDMKDMSSERSESHSEPESETFALTSLTSSARLSGVSSRAAPLVPLVADMFVCATNVVKDLKM